MPVFETCFPINADLWIKLLFLLQFSVMAQQINYTGYNLHWIGLGQKIHKVFFAADEPEKQ